MSRRVLAGAAVIAGLVAVYEAWTVLRLGGEGLTVAFEDYGQGAAAAAGAVYCLLAARRSSGRLRWGWSLLALSAFSWATGELMWAVQEVNLGIAVPFPSGADAGFLGAIPLAAAAALVFPFGPSSASGRLRVVLDGLIVATSLAFVAWSIGLGDLYAQTRVGLMGGLILVTYPAGDLLVLTLLAMGLRRAGRLRPMLVVLMAAFAASLAADSSYAYLTLRGEYGVLGSIFDAGWIAGYLGIALAATLPADAVDAGARDDEVEMWQLGIPWIAVVGVIGASIYVVVANRHPGVIATVLGTGMGAIFIAGQFLTFNDAQHLLTRSRRAEAELQQRTSLLAQVIGRAPVGIARIDKDSRFIEANPALAEMLGVPAQVLGASPFARYLAEPDADLPKRVARMLSGELDHVEIEGGMRCADGRILWVHRRITPVFTPEGRFQYFLVMFEDVTSKHEIEQAGRANLAELERINRLKSEFMSMVSHEFRTALTGIQGYSEVLNTEEVSPEEVKEFAGDINSESLRLNRMITEMLDLDRIESGRIVLHVEPLDLNALVAGVVERAQMMTSKHTIASNLDPHVAQVPGDSDRLTQVVSNLVSNAIKYSPAGGEISVTTSSRQGEVEVTVRDHGQGIPPEFLKKIFGRYERYEGPGKAQVVGTGLGLAIAQQIVQLHRGRIWVDSTVGEGSSFHFTLPAAAAVERVA